MDPLSQKILELALLAAEEAGKEIISIYNHAEFRTEYKPDNSPLTLADKAAHNKITYYLKDSYPILSEEGKEVAADIRQQWEYFWLVDPLDGTKEFINRNGEFTVNIALIHKGYPILGIVYCPVLEKMYWAQKDRGSHLRDKNGNNLKISGSRSGDDQNMRIVSSRLHTNAITEEYISQFPDATLVSMGSSLKFLMLAEGKADIYPRFVPTMEWDTAAAQIIVEQAGGEVISAITGERLMYNKNSLLNPSFIARGLKVNLT